MGTSQTENVRPKGLGVRHLQAVLLFFGMIFAFTMRVNISMAIVDMTNRDRPGAKEPDAIFLNIVLTLGKGFPRFLIRQLYFLLHYPWEAQTQSYILSSFFWGYVLLQLPAGALANRFGGKILFTLSISVNSLLSLLIPVGTPYGGWIFVCVCRVLQGMTQSFVYPSMHHLISQWVPLEEKGLLSTIIYAGGQLGIALQLIASGFLASAWGWQSIFYVNATLGLIWTVVYVLYGSASPEQSRIMSQAELVYIQKSLGRHGEQKRYPIPWMKIMTSLPFWAVIVAHCGQNWGFFTLMTEMPTYMANVLNVKLKSNGVMSAMPYLAMYALSFVMGAMTDIIIRKKWLSVSNTRKLFNSIGLWGPAIALIGLSYSPEGNVMLAEILMIFTVGMNAGQYTGYMLVHIDLAPNFSATLMSITNFLANIMSIIAPLACGAIVKDPSDSSEWRIVFYLAAAIYFFSNIFFVMFCTSEKQSWNEPKKNDLDLIESPPPSYSNTEIWTSSGLPNVLEKTPTYQESITHKTSAC